MAIGQAEIAATGGAGRRSARFADRPINQLREAHHFAGDYWAARTTRFGGRQPEDLSACPQRRALLWPRSSRSSETSWLLSRRRRRPDTGRRRMAFQVRLTSPISTIAVANPATRGMWAVGSGLASMCPRPSTAWGSRPRVCAASDPTAASDTDTSQEIPRRSRPEHPSDRPGTRPVQAALEFGRRCCPRPGTQRIRAGISEVSRRPGRIAGHAHPVRPARLARRRRGSL